MPPAALSLASLILFSYFCSGCSYPRAHELGSPRRSSPRLGFDFHHRFSDPVRSVLGVDVPVGTTEYYSLLSSRDRLIHGRRLSSPSADTFTFLGGNATYRIDALGYLHYANVTIGNPSLSFLVALDTGSDLFWLPCDCIQCVKGLRTSTGEELLFDIYSPNASTTSATVSCKSGYCSKKQQASCPAERVPCLYQVNYLSENTSSIGVLVEDVLHLTAEDDRSKTVDARVMFGCGRIQTGTFLTGIGRIIFGDQGSPDQGETPFFASQVHPVYNVTIAQIVVGDKAHVLEFTAIFDSGTSFTLLADPAYSLLTKSFDALVKEKRFATGPENPFEYCYELSKHGNSLENITLGLNMKGGNTFLLTKPLESVSDKGKPVSCLAVVKSSSINIIGQNFMTGYRVVFDRERMVLGWKASNCFDEETDEAATLPVNPGNSSLIVPSASLNPEATTNGSTNGSLASSATLHTFDLHQHLSLYILSLIFILVTHLPIL
ncbi:hypothetical protein MLD38_007832 [Melastoma candidum]|uniref:Uncharacterized protein n=1 Tax=Melastoma candidum TaxID=119954 RepID=A0ACB9RS00_9MYRT|nr:hypothetical protein MLD38_007832 [Melastoma candidum]